MHMCACVCVCSCIMFRFYGCVRLREVFVSRFGSSIVLDCCRLVSGRVPAQEHVFMCVCVCFFSVRLLCLAFHTSTPVKFQSVETETTDIMSQTSDAMY